MNCDRCAKENEYLYCRDIYITSYAIEWVCPQCYKDKYGLEWTDHPEHDIPQPEITSET